MSYCDNHSEATDTKQRLEQRPNGSLTDSLRRAQRSLRRTRVRCSLTMLVVLGYMSYTTVAIQRHFLSPKPAAAWASHCVSSLFAPNRRPEFRGLVEQKSSLVAGFLRMSFESSASSDGRSVFVAKDSLPRLQIETASRASEFLPSDPAKIRDLVQMVENPGTVQELSNALDAEIRERLPAKNRAGLPDPAYLESLCQTMAALSGLEWQLNRLAYANDLTPYEKLLRQAIAVTMGNNRTISRTPALPAAEEKG